MSKIGEIYRNNIYGIMGTLIFHILLFLAFILAEVDMKGNVQEEELLIEFPDVLPEPEDVVEEEQEQQEQQESMEFLGRAMMIALAIILLILVTQFNSVIKPLIILASVLFSTIGVFGGLATFKMDFIVVMTGIGIVSLAGIVVNNAIVLIDYIELLKSRKRKELDLDPDAFLPVDVATECVVLGGKTRLRPVLLTAITTILGLISLAIGLNFDFAGLLKEYNPDIYFGGDQVLFWGPISWTVIFGLTFSTFLTLVIVPVMYRLTTLAARKFQKWFPQLRKDSNGNGGMSPAAQMED